MTDWLSKLIHLLSWRLQQRPLLTTLLLNSAYVAITGLVIATFPHYLALTLAAYLLAASLTNWALFYIFKASHLGRIEAIVEFANSVSSAEDLSHRLTIERKDTLSKLKTGFNQMLDAIQQRERLLQEHGERLEELIELRTKQLHVKANYDQLTRLPNRYLLIERMNHCITSAARRNVTLGVLFLDLDRFKIINDNLGHSLGDELLMEAARCLKETVRPSDTVARWGGDEFVVFLEDLRHASDTARVAEKIIHALNRPFHLGEDTVHISTCIGISTYPKDGMDSGTLLKNADISMYRAKDRGPGNYCFYENNMQAASLKRLALEAQLRNAIANKEFFLVYQPKINTLTEQASSVEALIRWRHPQSGLMPPNEFIPVAEETGLIKEIGIWVLQEACRQNHLWQLQGLPAVQIAVNLAPCHLAEAGLAQKILQILQDNELGVEHLEIEITENTFLDASPTVLDTLEQLKQAGVSIAIDDFGTGYSCLSYLRDFPVDTLKIDGTFISRLGDGKSNDGIVAATVTLGHSLGLEIVAECVETEAQFSTLKGLACDKIQGYYYSKPLLPEECFKYLSQHQLSPAISPSATKH